jgi:hypothetical protein
MRRAARSRFTQSWWSMGPGRCRSRHWKPVPTTSITATNWPTGERSALAEGHPLQHLLGFRLQGQQHIPMALTGGDHRRGRRPAPCRSGSASAGADRFSVREAVEVRLSRQVVKGPPGHRHLRHGTVTQVAAVLLLLPEQPAAMVSRQAADHRQQVLRELGIGLRPRLSSLNIKDHLDHKGPGNSCCCHWGQAPGACPWA